MFHVGSYLTSGVLAFAGPIRPHTVHSAVTGSRNAQGVGQRSTELDTEGGGGRTQKKKLGMPSITPGPGLTVAFLTTVFMVRNLRERDCVPIAEGHRRCVMFGMSPPAHNNIMLATATHCCLF